MVSSPACGLAGSPGSPANPQAGRSLLLSTMELHVRAVPGVVERPQPDAPPREGFIPRGHDQLAVEVDLDGAFGNLPHALDRVPAVVPGCSLSRLGRDL